MKRLILTTVYATAIATAGLADQSKSAMSAKEIEKQMVISTQGEIAGSSSSTPIFVMLFALTVLAAAAAAGTGGGSHYVPYPH